MAFPNPVFKAGNTAVITGGASGIGLALARKCAGYGMNVVICDWNSSDLKAAKESIKGEGKIEGIEMDVSKVEDYAQVKSVVEQKLGGNISVLALNAGTALRKPSWTDATYFQQTLAVNTLGITNGLAVLLPLVTNYSTAAHPAAIIITGSKQGITNPPGNPAYNASKAAVKALAEHLSFDLSKESPTTSVHLLVPGWTFTGLSGNKPFAKGEEKKGKPEGAWAPEQVVEFLEENMAIGAFYVLCPDNDVSEEMDRKRILWGVGDLLKGRPPLTRWREDWVVEAEQWMEKANV